MAFFQQRPQSNDTIKYVSFGQQKTVLVVGLGNFEEKYDGTRHNVGFACADAFVNANEDLQNWVEKKDLKCLESSGQLGENRVIVVKPTTYMNNSGQAVQAVSHFYKIDPQHILVIHDELDIPFGQIRTRNGGGTAGHNGVKSVVEHIGEDFGRLRIGVGPKEPEQMDGSDFVLAKFSAEQQPQLKNLTNETTAIITEYIYGGQLPHETRNFIV